MRIKKILKITSIILILSVIMSVLTVPVSGDEQQTDSEQSVSSDNVALSKKVIGAVNKSLSGNTTVKADGSIMNIPRNNKYGVNNAGFWNYDNIRISKEYGTVSYSDSLLELNGINGLDLNLGLRFDSDSAKIENNFYNSRYNFGVGWSLNIPSIEINTDEKYFHTADGNKYKVKTGNKLEGYLLNDITFANAGKNEFAVDSVAAKYKTTDINKNKNYFDELGRYLGTVDVIGNKIKVCYNNDGFIDKIIEPAGRYVKFDYSTAENAKTVTIKLYDNTKAPTHKNLFTIKENYNENDYYTLSTITDAIEREVNFSYNIEEQTVDLKGIENYNGAYTGIEYTNEKVTKCFKKQNADDNEEKAVSSYNYKNEESKTISTALSGKVADETTIDANSRCIKERSYSVKDNIQEDISITEYSQFNTRNYPTVTITKTMGEDGTFLYSKNTCSYDGYGNVLDSYTFSGSGKSNEMTQYSKVDSKTSNYFNYNLSKSTPVITAEYTKAETDKIFAKVTQNTISLKMGKTESSITKTYDMTNVSSLNEFIVEAPKSDQQNSESDTQEETTDEPIKAIKELTQINYTYSDLGNLIKEEEIDLTQDTEEKQKVTTSYAYDGKYKAYVVQTNQSGIKNAEGQVTSSANGSSDIITRSQFDMLGNEIVSYDTYGNKTIKEYDAVGNLIKTSCINSVPYKPLYDWETEKVGTEYLKIGGFTNDSSHWNSEFRVTDNLRYLCSGSGKGIEIKNITNNTANCRVALRLTREMMQDSLGIKLFAVPNSASDSVKVEFRLTGSSYDVYSNVNKNGGWIDISWNGRMYQNGPSIWQWTNGSESDLVKSYAVWITFRNVEPGETVYLDDVQVLRKNPEQNVEVLSENQYDFTNNITTVLNKDGTGTKTYSDAFGNVLKTEEKLSNGTYKTVTENTYNNDFRLVTEKNYVTNDLYKITTNSYNYKDELSKAVVKDNSGKTLSTAEYKNEVKTVDAVVYNVSTQTDTTELSGEKRVNTTKTYSDASGNTVKTETKNHFEEDGHIEDKTTFENNVYASFGELLKTSGDETPTEKYTQDSAGQTVITATNDGEKDLVESTVIDGFGQSICETDANTNAGKELDADNLEQDSGVITKYDSAGRVIETKTPFKEVNGKIVYSIERKEYDANNNVTLEKTYRSDSDYSVKINTYDAKNNLIMVEQKNGWRNSQFTQYAYDINNRVTAIFSGLSRPLKIESADNVTPTGDEDYSTIRYTYDFYGNKTSYTDNKGKKESYEYNEYSGWLAKVIKRDGTVVSYTYDVNGNLITETAVKGEKTVKKTYTYNADNKRKTAVISNNGEEQYRTEYYYNASGNLYKERTVNPSTNRTVVKEYSYNDKGSVTESKASVLNGDMLYIKNYEYTDDDKVKTETVKTSENGTAAKIEYTYDANGNVLTKTLSKGADKEITSTYIYNLANLCTSESHQVKSGDSVNTTNYVYDYYTDGNMTSKTINGKVKTQYSYDKLNRLTAEEHLNYNENTGKYDKSVFKEEYSFDDYNNIAEKVHKEQDESKNTVTVSAYDKTRLVSQTESVPKTSSEENPQQLSQISYTYDDNGNMSGKTQVKGEDTILTEFSYDTFDRTTSIKTGDKITSFIYDCDGERVSKTTGSKVTESVLDNGSISADVVNNNGAVTTKVYTDDNAVFIQNGVITLNAIDCQGDIVSVSINHNAYGIKANNGETANPIDYRNYYYDNETGLYYLKARYYDPTTGQFTQEDTVHDDNLQYNLYGYCSANPVRYKDPSGHKIKSSDMKFTMSVKNKSTKKAPKYVVKVSYNWSLVYQVTWLEDQIAIAWGGGLEAKSISSKSRFYHVNSYRCMGAGTIRQWDTSWWAEMKWSKSRIPNTGIIFSTPQSVKAGKNWFTHKKGHVKFTLWSNKWHGKKHPTIVTAQYGHQRYKCAGASISASIGTKVAVGVSFSFGRGYDLSEQKSKNIKY